MLGILAGIVFLPFFIAAVLIYLIVFIVAEAFALCECYILECCSLAQIRDNSQSSFKKIQEAK